jgi:hypothetical protein
MAKLDEKGVADVITIAIMFILVVFAGMLLHVWSLGPLESVEDRQFELRSLCTYQVLDKAWVDPYSQSFLRAAAEQMAVENANVPKGVLENYANEIVEFLAPDEYGVVVKLTDEDNENNRWPENENIWPWTFTENAKYYATLGQVSLTRATSENRIFVAKVEVTLFELQSG